MKNQCVNSFVQEYQCQVLLTNKICCDRCLADEILKLNNIGIKTIGSCCGRHVNTPADANAYIQVENGYVGKMVELGYEILPTDSHGNGLNCFQPKSVLPETRASEAKYVGDTGWLEGCHYGGIYKVIRCESREDAYTVVENDLGGKSHLLKSKFEVCKNLQKR